MKKCIEPGDAVVDATCGRGKDTLFLARLVGPSGKVWAFDIQPEAIESTRQHLVQAGCIKQVVLISDDHKNIGKHVKQPVNGGMFNLGYLPGGDHRLVTRAESTLAALEGILDLLVAGGRITLVCYPGHPGGAAEYEQLSKMLAALPQRQYEILETGFVNQRNARA